MNPASVRKITLSAILIFTSFYLIIVPAMAHFTFPMQVDRPGYNATIELLQVLGDGTGGDGADLDQGAASISTGNIQINIYLLDQSSQPIDDAEVELSLTKGVAQVGPLPMDFVAVGQYSTTIEISEDGNWDSMIRVSVPSETTPIVARFTNIPVLPLSEGGGMAPLIGGIALVVIGIIVIFGFMMKRKDKDGESKEEAA